MTKSTKDNVELKLLHREMLKLVDRGFAVINGNGTYTLTDEGAFFKMMAEAEFREEIENE